MGHFLNDSELSVFADQLSMILHSGISVLEGISIMRDDMPKGEGQDILSKIYNTLEESGYLSDALRDSGVFPDYFVEMTAVGERSGMLEDVLSSLSGYYQRQDSFKHSIRDAFVYPLVLLGMLLAVLIVLMTQVMPVFREVFGQLGIEISGVSAAVFRISKVLQVLSIALLVLIIAVSLICVFALRTKKGQEFLSSVVYCLPFGRTSADLLSCSRFSHTLSLALHSGLDIGESFEMAAKLADQKSFQKKTKLAQYLIEQGNDFADSLRESHIFSGLNARMVSIGFRTGSSEEVFERISASCQEEADDRIQSAIGMLEPTLTAVLSILTGLILVSVMLPLLQVMANIG